MISAPHTHTYQVCPACAHVSVARADQFYCVWCGARLLAQCPTCASPIMQTPGKFCHNCGTLFPFGTKSIRNGVLNKAGGSTGVERWSREMQHRFRFKYLPDATTVRTKK